jgi:hypothetical protein
VEGGLQGPEAPHGHLEVDLGDAEEGVEVVGDDEAEAGEEVVGAAVAENFGLKCLEVGDDHGRGAAGEQGGGEVFAGDGDLYVPAGGGADEGVAEAGVPAAGGEAAAHEHEGGGAAVEEDVQGGEQGEGGAA